MPTHWNPHDDDEAIRRLHTGDESVLRDVLSRLGVPAQSSLARVYGRSLCHQDFEDVVVFATMKVWENRSDINREQGGLKAFFVQICKYKAIELLRRRVRSLRLAEEYYRLRLSSGRGDRSEVSEDDEQRSQLTSRKFDELMEIVGRLPEALRRVILADADSSDETASTRLLAEELGLSQSTIRVYRSRARSRILREYGGGDRANNHK
jgi:RNA polymerase sigma factor (sigma-70 family)